MILCPACKTQNADNAAFCVQCHQFFPPDTPRVAAPPLSPSYPGQPPMPQAMYMPAPAPKSDGTMGGLIPIHNPKALLSYYLGLFSLFPAFGFFLGVAAIIFAIQGLKFQKAHPEARGKTHALVGLVCGTLFGLFNLLLLIIFIVALLAHPTPQMR